MAKPHTIRVKFLKPNCFVSPRTYAEGEVGEILPHQAYEEMEAGRAICLENPGRLAELLGQDNADMLKSVLKAGRK